MPLAGVQLSIVIATRNRAAYLDRCLESVLGQLADADTEMLVVNNGSTDGTPYVLSRWEQRDPRVRSLVVEQRGKSRALNAGLEAARGRFVLFTDDDVMVQSRWSETLRAFLLNSHDDLVLVGGPVLHVPEDLGAWPAWLGRDLDAKVGSLSYGPGQRELAGHEQLWGANLAARAELFTAIGGWDESIGPGSDLDSAHEDLEMQARVRSHGGAVWYVGEAVVHHRVRRQDVTPRGVVYRAFHGGMSEVTTHLHSDRVAISRVRASAVLQRVAVGSARWWITGTSLRLRLTPNLVDRARRAAHAVGSDIAWLDGLTASKVLSTGQRRILTLVRRFARALAWRILVRAAPDR